MKKVLFVYHTSLIGGGSNCLLNIIKHLDKDSFSPFVLLREEGPLSIELRKLDIPVYFSKYIFQVPYNQSLLSIKTFITYIKIFIGIIPLLLKIRILNPEIVYINTFMLYYVAIVKLFGLKNIVHVREHWPKNEHAIQFGFARWVVKTFANYIISINQTSDELIDLRHKSVVIYDWVEFENITDNEVIELRDRLNLKNNDKIFLFLGGLQAIKGVIEVIRAFKHNVTDINAKLLIVGGSEKHINYSGSVLKILKAFYHKITKLTPVDKAIIRMIKDDDRIILTPYSRNIRAYYELATCVISFPTVPHASLPVAEAIILRKPVIAAATPETLEYSSDGELATIVPIKDEQNLGNALRLYSENNKINLLDNESAVLKVEEMFKPEPNIYKLNQILNKI